MKTQTDLIWEAWDLGLRDPQEVFWWAVIQRGESIPRQKIEVVLSKIERLHLENSEMDENIIAH